MYLDHPEGVPGQQPLSCGTIVAKSCIYDSRYLHFGIEAAWEGCIEEGALCIVLGLDAICLRVGRDVFAGKRSILIDRVDPIARQMRAA
jgi:hypothetical protein